jgi:hypothetical protein
VACGLLCAASKTLMMKISIPARRERKDRIMGLTVLNHKEASDRVKGQFFLE